MDREYSLRLEKIEARLDAAFPRDPGGAWLDAVFPGVPVSPEQVRDLAAPGRDLLDRGGKRWRPLLALLVCEAAGGGDAALPLTPLVEFPHNASLIHDDIEDESGLRRGKPAVHLIYGNDAAINSGSFLYFLPLAALEAWDAPPVSKNRVFSLWAAHMRRLHLGQSMDIAWHNSPGAPETAGYYLMCGLKTGCLARFAALLGLAAACSVKEWRGEVSPPASTEVRDRAERGGPGQSFSAPPPLFPGPFFQAACGLYGEAAEKLGTGFQILDDVKNLDTGVPGKKLGDDIVEGKKSLPVILYLRARPEKAGFAAGCFRAAREKGADAGEIGDFIAEMKNAGVLEEARRQGEALIAEAGEAFSRPLDGAETPDAENARRLLAGFTELLR